MSQQQGIRGIPNEKKSTGGAADIGGTVDEDGAEGFGVGRASSPNEMLVLPFFKEVGRNGIEEAEVDDDAATGFVATRPSVSSSSSCVASSETNVAATG